jgi:hypothetical protein
MDLNHVGIVALFCSIPLSFWIIINYNPQGHVLIPWADQDKNPKVAIYSIPLGFPTALTSVVLVYVTMVMRKCQELVGDDSDCYDSSSEEASEMPGNRQFWCAVTVFVFTKTFLLMHYVDLYSLLLNCLLSITALITSCMPVNRDIVCYRIVGISAFVLSLLPITLLAAQHATSNEMYVLALLFCADGLLLIGHTYDFPACQKRTVINARTAYMFALLVLFPAALLSSVEAF